MNDEENVEQTEEEKKAQEEQEQQDAEAELVATAQDQGVIQPAAPEQPAQPQQNPNGQQPQNGQQKPAATPQNNLVPPAQQTGTQGNTAPATTEENVYAAEGGMSTSKPDYSSMSYDEAIKTVDQNDEQAMLALYQQYYDENGNPRNQNGQGNNTPTASGGYGYVNYDPSKSYGRTDAKPGYNYSYDAKQLQNQINREIFQYNRDIASGKIPGKTAADYIQPLKVDGMFGAKTKEAMEKLGYDTSKAYVASGNSNNTSTPAAPASPASNEVQGDEGSAALATGYNMRTPSAPTGNGAYWDANRDATARDRQLEAINAKGQAMDEYYRTNQQPTNFLADRIKELDDMAANDPNAYMAMAYGIDPSVNTPAVPKPGQNNGNVTDSGTGGNGANATFNSPVVGNEDANLQDLIEEANRRAERGYLMETPSAPTGDSAYWNAREPERRQEERNPINYDAMADELFQMDRNDWYQRPETSQAPERTPIEYSDAFLRQQDMNDSYSPNQAFNDNYRAMLERQQNEELDQMDRRDAYSPNMTPPRQPIEYSDAFLRQQDQMDAYSPYANYNSGSMASDDIQSSGNASSEDQEMLAAYEAAMQSADRARGIFANEAEAIQQTREQWQQNQRNALEQQIGPFMRQFQQDYQNYRQQFPNYPDSAIMDMILMNEENNYGRSSYYNWLVNSLG